MTTDQRLRNAISEAGIAHDVYEHEEGWAYCSCTLAKGIRLIEKVLIQGHGRIDNNLKVKDRP